MQFKQLEIFKLIVEYGSFSKAGEALFMTQPSITSSIKKLEEELGCMLIDRSYKKITLTQEGNLVYKHAKNLLNQKNNLITDLGEISNLAHSELNIHSSSFGADVTLPTFLPGFIKKYPSTKISINITNSGETLNLIKSGAINIGIVGEKSNTKEISFKLISKNKLVLITPKSKEYNFKTIASKDLLSLPLIIRGKNSASLHVLYAALKQQNINKNDLNIVLEVDDNYLIKKLVSSGVGCSIINETSVSTTDNVIIVEIEDLDLDREFYIAYNNKRILSRIEQKFIEDLSSFVNQKK